MVMISPILQSKNRYTKGVQNQNPENIKTLRKLCLNNQNICKPQMGRNQESW